MKLGPLAALALTIGALAACNDSREATTTAAAASAAPRAQVAAGAPALAGAPDLRCPPTFPTVREVAAGTEGDLNQNGRMCVGQVGAEGRERRVDDLMP